jgi:hypothetical protein
LPFHPSQIFCNHWRLSDERVVILGKGRINVWNQEKNKYPPCAVAHIEMARRPLHWPVRSKLEHYAWSRIPNTSQVTLILKVRVVLTLSHLGELSLQKGKVLSINALSGVNKVKPGINALITVCTRGSSRALIL